MAERAISGNRDAQVYDLTSRRMVDGGEHDAEREDVTPAAPGAPVDPPPQRRDVFAAVVSRDADRRPVVPASLRGWDNLRALARWALGYTTHATLFHLARLPLYAGRVASYAPIGAARLAGRQIRWWWFAEQAPLRQEAATRNEPEIHMRLHTQAKATRAWRAGVLTAEAFALVIAGSLVRLFAPWWAQLAAAVLVVGALARLGRPAGKPITARVSTSPRYYRLTAEMTRAAIMACGVGVKDPAAIRFPREIFRDGPGHTAVVDLPAEPVVVTAEAVIDKRTELAGALRLPKSQVWPSTSPGEHPSRLHLWVAERPVNDMTPPPWDLLARGRTDYWRPFVYGYDARMRPVTWRLNERNGLFAGIPGSGKSLAVRVVVLGGICDPLVVPVIFELKGIGDFDPIAPLCPDGLYGSGADDTTKRAALDAMEWLLRECDRRGPLIKEWVGRLGLDENKLTREIARRDPRLRPVLAVFDEVQELFASPDKDIRNRSIAAATSLVKRGRALGIHLILATQRIDDKSIPKGVSSNIANRMCLAVNSHTEVELVLGTGSYRRGARPTEFEPAQGDDPKDSGWGWAVGLGPMAAVRSVYLDNKAAHRVVARAVAMREGMEAAATAKAQARDFLADVRGVFHAGEAWVAWPALAMRLADAHPDAYAAITADAVSSQARGLGVESVNGKVPGGGGRVAKGAKLAAVDAAATEKAITDG